MDLRLAPQLGFEPRTLRLTAECSTIELLRSKEGKTPSLHQTCPLSVKHFGLRYRIRMTLKFQTLLYLALAGTAVAQAPKPQPLRLQKSIPLPGVEGRLDHMAVDLKGQRLFVAATGNGSVEVIDLKTGKLLRSVKGFKGPQGIAYCPESNRLVVAGRDDGSIQFLDGTSFGVLV